MNKKAFTLAEVLITLSILGVVAALTIPALVNRNSDIAAQTKLKKAIAAYETMAAVYMAENETADLTGLTCSGLKDYFKQIDGAGTCSFTTADGAYWMFNTDAADSATTGIKQAIVYDAKDAPRYGVAVWTANGRVNSLGAADGANNILANSVNPTVSGDAPTIANTRNYSAAPLFMDGKYWCKASISATAAGATSITCAQQ